LLVNISLRNFALIDSLELELFDNFNTLTGETGAGKSILIDAVGLCIGGRASTTYIRSGADKCSVLATFYVKDNEEVEKILTNYGLVYEDNLIIEREIARNGRNTNRVNGSITTLKVLSELGEHLINIYGQHEHTMLLKDDYQLELVDSWGSKRINPIKHEITEIIKNIRKVEKELDEIGIDKSLIARELDILEFQINEIQSSNLYHGELEELENESKFLKNAERIFSVLMEVDKLFNDELSPIALYDKIGDCSKQLENIIRFDNEIEPLAKMANSIYYDLQELENLTEDYRLKFDFDPNRLIAVEDRLNIIHRLRKKYGDSVEDIIEFLEKAKQRADLLTNSEELRKSLNKQLIEYKEDYLNKAMELSKARQESADEFTNLIEKGIKDLGMEHSRLKCVLEFDKSKVSLNGSNQIKFLFSANKGEPLENLAEVISGGELSRLMLEIKTRFTALKDTNAIIFDEIDVGIGGKVASAVARKIASLSNDRQVLCVTHLPVIAAKAQHHYVVEKRIVEDRTITKVLKVENEKRVEEVMRMIGAEDDITRQQAQRLLDL